MVLGEVGVWGRSVGWCSDRGCFVGVFYGLGMVY